MRKALSVFQYAEFKIAILKSEGRSVTAKNYKATLNSLKRFRPGESLTFSQITESFVLDYNQFLKDQGIQMATISFYNRTLRSIYHQAVRDGLLKNAHPFDDAYTKVVTKYFPMSNVMNEYGKQINLEDLSWDELLRQYKRLQHKYNMLVGRLTTIVGV